MGGVYMCFALMNFEFSSFGFCLESLVIDLLIELTLELGGGKKYKNKLSRSIQ